MSEDKIEKLLLEVEKTQFCMTNLDMITKKQKRRDIWKAIAARVGLQGEVFGHDARY